MPMERLSGIYAGSVEDANDPLQLGRLKARVPVAYGPAGQATNSVPTGSIPWALPAGLPAGGTQNSGSIAWLPAAGDHVFVMFLDGEPEKPVWLWGMQDSSQAATTGVWDRTPGGYTDSAPPASALLTRYGHSLDIQPDSIMIRTANGYKLRFTDSTQQLDVYAPNMVGLVGNLKFTGTAYQFNPSESFSISTDTANVTASNLNGSTLNTTLAAKVAAYIQSPHIELGPKGQATDPVVRLSDLVAIATLILTQFNAHTHPGVFPGPSATAPPALPMALTASASATTFSA